MFYSFIDHLVYFTSYCINAAKHDITVLGLTQMPDHLHDSLLARSARKLAEFKREQNSWFAKQQNEFCNISGPVFWHPYGSASKPSEKQVRTNLIYVGNNPVERHLVEKAEDYRWNYIAYAASESPFSKKLVIRRCSPALAAAVKNVRFQYQQDLPMNYQLLLRLFKPLDSQQTQQLIDFIINQYNVIDYEAALEFFGGSYPRFLVALHSTTGSEYDIKEKKTGRSDLCYAQMSDMIINEYGLADIHDFLSMDRREIYTMLRSRTAFPERQILKFLRMRDWEVPRK